jgi:hypothetical protein
MIPEGSKEFLVAVAGAAAALAGMLFVALSINLSRILAFPGLPARGAEALVILGAALMAPLVALLPGQSSWMLGVEVGAVGLVAWGLPVALQIAEGRIENHQRHQTFPLRVALHQVATLPFLLASAAMLGLMSGAWPWLVTGVLLALVVGLFSAWVLLIEIVR